VFSTDLFAQPAAAPAKAAPIEHPPAPSPPRSKTASTPGKTPAAPQPKTQTPLPKSPVKAPVPPPPPSPKPAPAPEEVKAPKAESIKIVTDDDLRALFDMSSPGFGPEEEPAPPEEKPVATAPAGSDVKAEEPALAMSEEVEELYVEGKVESAGPAPGPALDPESVQEISPEEIVDQIETRAQVGEMTVGPAAKKGEALQQTAQALSGLEPVGDDFMSVDELKKLFNNVNILIQWARENAERLERIERKISKLLPDKGGK
jgi:hypothetical protein